MGATSGKTDEKDSRIQRLEHRCDELERLLDRCFDAVASMDEGLAKDIQKELQESFNND
jgi:hypothetical protein